MATRTHASRVPFDGDTGRALDFAIAIITPLGFRVAARDETSFEALGPGMNSTRESALLGASRIRITRSHGELILDADLTAADRLARFATVFPIGLSLTLGVVLGGTFLLMFHRLGLMLPAACAAGANAILWLVLGPVAARYIRRRTRAGLDALLQNASAADGRQAKDAERMR